MKQQKIVQIVAVILAIIVILLVLRGCQSHNVDNTLKSFETAAHNLDVREMIKCVDPTISMPTILALNVMGVSDTSELLQDVFDLINMKETGVAAEMFFKELEIKPIFHRYNLLRNKCIVNAKVLYGIEGLRNEMDTTITLVKKDGNWYISTFALT